MEPDVIDRGHRATVVRTSTGKQLGRNEEKNTLNHILRKMRRNFKAGKPLS